MRDTPIVKLDPERLQAERDSVNLGEDTASLDRVTRTTDDEGRDPDALGDSTAGILPPAR